MSSEKANAEILKKNLIQEALDYHKGTQIPAGSGLARSGKIEVVASKSLLTQRDLNFAYTPGVAEPCKEIFKDPENAYLYTAKSNLVGVITNGTAVLGLGNIGPLAGKPVMEGKAVLFKKLADIDCFDIEVNAEEVDRFVEAVATLEPTFGGINLEDIRAPDCFEIEKQLRSRLNIPVFHDDQHGTAIISGAAFLNATEIAKKSLDTVKVVFCGGGAASISCAHFWLSLGLKKENVIMTDRLGVIYDGRTEDMNPYKQVFALKGNAWHKKQPKTLAEAMVGADVFVGCSVGNILTPDMLKVMAPDPIVFAMANPEPEIMPEVALAARQDMIFATGRSDFPNQVNNVLGYPFIFRGALDVRAKAINEQMKVAAARALASLAKQEIPESVLQIYGLTHLEFGPQYIIPKPFDPRVLLWVAPAVAQAAIDTGVARLGMPGGSLEAYRARLEKLLGNSQSLIRDLKNRVKVGDKKKAKKVRIVFPEGNHERILKAASVLREENIAEPILLGNIDEIKSSISKFNLENLSDVEIIRPSLSPLYQDYVDRFSELRKRKGFTPAYCAQLMKDPFYFGAMHVRLGRANAWIAGISRNYPSTIRPALHVVGSRGGQKVAGLHMMIWKDRIVFLADTTVNIEPTAEDLAEIAIDSAHIAESFGFEPAIAMLSFSNFGSNRHAEAIKMQDAATIVQRRRPDLRVDGEMQADTAIDPKILQERFPFCRLQDQGANILIFPNLAASNICYKLLSRLGGAESIGPILMGMNKPIHVLQVGCEVKDVVNISVIAAIDAQRMLLNNEMESLDWAPQPYSAT